ncbi:hypothetical protein Daus18300_010503 [Diaporthe australafricana]|uniref:Phytanoyl-CoA dioxygenase n=1 Tax=Diaporthe australafricana TaxID=127596 RepID=A0ABR3WA86_9PEZI
MVYQYEDGGNYQRIYQEVGSLKKLKWDAEPVDADTQKLIDQVVAQGYVIIKDAFTNAQADEALEDLARLSAASDAGPAAAGGRNTFEGFQTQRIYNLVNKSRVFDKFILHPSVVALNNFFMDPGWLLSVCHSINIQPGENPQTLHHDDGHAIMVALGPYTETNGSTVVVPGSHTWGPDRVPQRSETVSVVMPRGSIVYFTGTLWHGGGQNKSDAARRALTVQYCQPWLRQLENPFLAVDWELLPQMPKQLVDILGYQVGSPFVGYVDGISPRRAVEKRLRKKQEEEAVIRNKL